MDHLNIQQFKNADEAALYAGYWVNKLLEDHPDKPVLLLLSGGSSFKLLESLNPAFLGERATISVLDERFSEDPKISNFLQLQETDFYKEAGEKGTNFIGTSPKPGDKPADVALRLDTAFKKWRQENPDGKIFATIGMGPDGHTAGMMPFPEDPKKFEEMFCGDAWVVGYNTGDKNPHPERVTTTITFLKQLDAAVAYICGQQRKTSFDRAKAKQNTVPELPAMAFWDINNLQIFTDLE